MPLYYKGMARGYDLDTERSFVLIDGEKCCVGSAGSIVLGCWTCGGETFRENPSPHERCLRHPDHGLVRPIRHADLPHYEALWEAEGDVLYGLAERRSHRLVEEALRPWNWVFGGRTEADYPEGYAKDPEIRDSRSPLHPHFNPAIPPVQPPRYPTP